MLRTSIRSVRALSSRPAAAAAARQWQPAGLATRRYFADKTDPPRPAAIPSSETTTAPSSRPPPAKAEANVASSTIKPGDVPRVPPTPTTPSPASAATTPPPPPPAAALAPKKKGFFRRLRNYVLTLALVGALAFGGGVWYSRVSDNFHDFFTEYVPFGEQAVLYLEEMEFRKRFPQVSQRVTGRKRDAADQVTVSAQSGASWRVADSGELSGRQSSSVRQAPSKGSAPAKPSKEEPPKLKPDAPPAAAAAAAAAATVASEPPTTQKLEPPPPAFTPPQVDEPSRFPPASPIDPLAVNGAREPVVQELVRMLNDIITVVNADGANERYGSTIGKAKNQLNKVAGKIEAIKAAAEKEAAQRVKTRLDEFDAAANELVGRVEGAMTTQEARWRSEFEAEMRRLKAGYDEKLRVVAERERQLGEERAGSRLLEQAVEMQRQFSGEVRELVERERGGRLGRLEELSAAVAGLEQLAAGWDRVVETNLRTQRLHVAAEAVRAASLAADAGQPRPFVRELVALKEVAAGDAVVDAAVASISPEAYQRGVSPPSELIARFRRVAAEVRKASLLPDDAGVASHASSWALSKVMFSKATETPAAGDRDVESILGRTQALLEEGDLDSAAREMNGLSGWARTLSGDWLREVRKVLELQQAMDVIQTEARLQSLKVE